MIHVNNTSWTPVYCCWECKLVQPLWKTVWRFLKKLKIELPYDPAITLLSVYLEKKTKTKQFNLMLLLLSCFSHVWLCSPIDGSPPGSPRDSPGKNTGVGCHFLLQCVKVKSLSRAQLLATSWTAAYQAPLSMGFSRQEYWSGVPLPPPFNLIHIP